MNKFINVRTHRRSRGEIVGVFSGEIMLQGIVQSQYLSTYDKPLDHIITENSQYFEKYSVIFYFWLRLQLEVFPFILFGFTMRVRIL